MESDIAVVEETALMWPKKAGAIIIKDQPSYDLAADTLIEIIEFEKRIKAHHSEMKTAAHNAHKAAVAAEKKFLDPLDKAKNLIKRSISGWETKQRRIRDEAEREAREKARKEEEEIRLAKALEAEEAGKPAKEIEEIMDTPEKIKPIIVKPTFEQNSRVSTRETWHAEVTNIASLCKAVAEGKVPMAAIQANIPLLNTMVRAEKESFSVPGVKAVKETNVVTR